MPSVIDLLLPHSYVFGVCELHGDGTLSVDGTTVHLPPKELHVLRLLLNSAGHLVSKDTLLERVWPRCDIGEDSLTRCICALRKALGKEQQYITTLYGKGYRLSCPVTAQLRRPAACGALHHRRLSRNVGPGAAPSLLHANCYTPAGLLRQAADYRAKLQLRERDAALWCRMAAVLIDQVALGLAPLPQLLEQIEQALGRALDLSPQCGEALMRLALVTSARGRFTAAQALFRSAQQLVCADEVEMLYYRAWHQWCWGEHRQAAALLEQALAIESSAMSIWLLRFRIAFAVDATSASTVVARARCAMGADHEVLMPLQAMLMTYQGQGAQALRLLGGPQMTIARGDPGLWQCYVLAHNGHCQAQGAFDRWRAQHDYPAPSAGQLAVLRQLEGDALASLQWQVLSASPCAWHRTSLDDPRLQGLAQVPLRGVSA